MRARAEKTARRLGREQLEKPVFIFLAASQLSRAPDKTAMLCRLENICINTGWFWHAALHGNLVLADGLVNGDYRKLRLFLGNIRHFILFNYMLIVHFTHCYLLIKCNLLSKKEGLFCNCLQVTVNLLQCFTINSTSSKTRMSRPAGGRGRR